MIENGDGDPWGAMPPRFLKSLMNLPNYIRHDQDMEVEGSEFHFRIEDYRHSHGTSTSLRGFATEDIEMYGFAILVSDCKVLLEIWNDRELNCWSEFDLSSNSQIFVKRDELGPYISRYVPNDTVIEHYLREIESDYSTLSMQYCHYYFESDRIRDLRKLESLKGLNTEQKFSEVQKEAELHFERNNKEGTWRGVCILNHARTLIFKGSEFEPYLWAEVYLIGNTALNWGGKSQKWYIRRARKYIPFISLLYEKTDEECRKSELWDLIFDQLLTSMMFRNWLRQGKDKIKDLSRISSKGETSGGKDAKIAKVFLEELLRTNLPTRKERKHVKSLVYRKR